MRYVIIVENDRVLVEFSEDDFRYMLKYFFEQVKDIDKAFDETREALTNKVRKI